MSGPPPQWLLVLGLPLLIRYAGVFRHVSTIPVLLVYRVHISRRLLLGSLGHGVQGTSVLEPLNLALVEGVRQLDVERLATVGGVDNHGEGLLNSKLSALEVDLVVGANLVVVGGV
jgi:hypothetical protein